MADLMGRILPKIFCALIMGKQDGAVSCSTSPIGPIVGSGGTVSYDGAYTVHRFTADDTFEIIEGRGDVEILIVGGGGAGGGCTGVSVATGGGGGGGVVEQTDTMGIGTYPVVVGAGGSATAHDTGNWGGDSLFNGHTAQGGGGGGSIANTRAGNNGGCGGGAGGDGGVAGFTYNGGAGSQGGGGGQSGSDSGGAGGGGGGGVGGNGSHASGGDGGIGLLSDITGVNTRYAGGGGGSVTVNAFGPVGGSTPGLGGSGGGAAGTAAAGPGTAGVNGLGGGGGGTSGNNVGGAGGSGVVIVRYLGHGFGAGDPTEVPAGFIGPITFAGCTRSQTVGGTTILVDCNSQNNTGVFPDYLEYECLGGGTVRSTRTTDGLLVFRFSAPVTAVRLQRLANGGWDSTKGKPEFIFCENYTVVLDVNGPPANGSKDGQIVSLHGYTTPTQDMTVDEVITVEWAPGFSTLVIFEQSTAPSQFNNVCFKLL